MRTGRPTKDPKVRAVRVRLNEIMAEHLIERSKLEGKTVSQVIRELVMDDIHTKQEKTRL